ncbi:MAG: pyruvate formate-lyase-activating protein [Atopobiaceae bacterium]|jgi:pyruvate formate lyase activating enzyme
MTAGRIHSLESFGSVDGPGVRFVIFLQGCKLRCRYCHNADTWDMAQGQMMEPQELIERACRYRAYWGREGGITVSGGEPLLQLDFVRELFSEAKARSISTCLDTALAPYVEDETWLSQFDELMSLTDLVLADVKHIDPKKHLWLTGSSNEPVVKALRHLDALHQPVWIRHVLVPGITDDDESLVRLAAFIHSLSNVARTEVLPYHTMGAYKWRELGLCYPLEGVEPPSAEAVSHAEDILGISQYEED